jgi:hypothetical protein
MENDRITRLERVIMFLTQAVQDRRYVRIQITFEDGHAVNLKEEENHKL